jgi:hypothetical protein
MKYYFEIDDVFSQLIHIHPSFKGSVFRTGVDSDPFTGKPVSVVECQEKKTKGRKWLPVGSKGHMWMFADDQTAATAADILNQWAVTVHI